LIEDTLLAQESLDVRIYAVLVDTLVILPCHCTCNKGNRQSGSLRQEL
jgi:hypothetical protein